MDKQAFLSALGDRLAALPQSDRERWLDFYAEMVDDRMEDGLTEQQAVAAMGSAEEIAAQIFKDTPLPTLVKESVRASRSLRGWEIALLVLGSPVWVPLLLAACIIVFSVYVVIWSVVVVFYAADLVFAAGALAGVVGGLVLGLTGSPVQSPLFFGAGLFCAGVAILVFFGVNALAVAVAKLGGWFLRFIKSRFVRKGATA